MLEELSKQLKDLEGLAFQPLPNFGWFSGSKERQAPLKGWMRRASWNNLRKPQSKNLIKWNKTSAFIQIMNIYFLDSHAERYRRYWQRVSWCLRNWVRNLPLLLLLVYRKAAHLLHYSLKVYMSLFLIEDIVRRVRQRGVEKGVKISPVCL